MNYTFQQAQEIYKDAKDRGLDPDKVMSGIVQRGGTIEGIDMNEARNFSAPQPVEESRVRGSETDDDLNQIMRGSRQILEDRQENIRESERALQAGEQSTFRTRLQQFGQGAGAIAGTVGEVVKGGIKALLPQKAEDKVKDFLQSEGVQREIQTVKDAPLASLLSEKYQALTPEKKRDVDALLGVAELGLELTGVGVADDVSKSVTKTAVRKLDDIGDNIVSLKKNVEEKIFTDNKVDTVRRTLRNAPAEELAQQQDTIRKTFIDDVISDTSSINKKMKKIAANNRTDTDTLLNELIEEGGIPGVKGSKTDFTDFAESINRENKAISEAINRRTVQLEDTIPTDEFRQIVLDSLPERGVAGNLSDVERRVNKLFDNYKRPEVYGDTLSVDARNKIRVEMNAKWKDLPDKFEIDAHRAIGDVARKQLTDIDSTLTDATSHQAKLNRVLQTVEALDLQKIAVNDVLDRLGGFAGVMLASGLSLGTIAGGPAGLLIAGWASALGAKGLSKVIRLRKFSPEHLDLIKASLDENPEILKKLIQEADEADKKLLEEL